MLRRVSNGWRLGALADTNETQSWIMNKSARRLISMTGTETRAGQTRGLGHRGRPKRYCTGKTSPCWRLQAASSKEHQVYRSEWSREAILLSGFVWGLGVSVTFLSVDQYGMGSAWRLRTSEPGDAWGINRIYDMPTVSHRPQQSHKPTSNRSTAT